VFSTHLLCPSVSWRNAWLYRGMVKRAHLADYASRDETSPGPHYGLWTIASILMYFTTYEGTKHLLSLATILLICNEGDRSCDTKTPKSRADLTTGRSTPPMLRQVLQETTKF